MNKELSKEELQRTCRIMEGAKYFGDRSISVSLDKMELFISTIEAQAKELERLNSVNHTFSLTIGEADKRIKQLRNQLREVEKGLEKIKSHGAVDGNNKYFHIANEFLSHIQEKEQNINDGVIISSPYISEKKVTGKISQGKET